MSRVINTDSTGKQRNQLMRTSAELLRHLSQKTTIDEETYDMVALLIYSLRDINEGIDQSAAAWEKRDYWMKAEGFRERWRWVDEMCNRLEAMVFDDDWDQLPLLMVQLIPRFSDIRINKFMRKPSMWQGCYERLIREQASGR